MSNKPSLYSRRPQHNDKYISESNGSEGTTASDSEGPNLDRPNTSSAAAGPPTQKQCRSKPGDSSGSDSSSSKQDYRSYQSSSKHDDCNGVGGGTRDHRATSASRDRASAQPMGRGTQGEALTSRHGRGAAGAFTSSRPRETYSRDMKTPIGEKSQLYGDESSRLSVLMKRVMREDDRRSSIVKQLREYMQTANPKVISKQADNVLESLQDLLQERGSSETKQELARCVGITGSVMGDDPQRYFNSVFGRVNAASTSDDVRVHLLKALMETLAITKERKVYFWGINHSLYANALVLFFLRRLRSRRSDLCVDRSCPPADPDLPSSSECISKITSLIRVFTTVIRSIGKYFQPTKGPPITTEYIVESLNRIMQCVLMSMEKHHSENLILHANHCVIELLAHLHGGATSCVTLLADFVEMQLAGPPSVPSKYLLTTLALILKVIQEVGGEMPVAFVSGALRTERAVAVARFSGEPALQQAAMQIYQALLGLKNVLLLDVAYRHLLIDMQRAVNALLTSGGSQRKPVIVEETTTSTPGATYTPPQARHVVMFLLGALTEIATTSNSIIGMWALTPSLFELLCHHLDPGMEDLAASHPVVQYCVLRLLNSLSTRHGNFISTSCLLSSQVAQTSGHLSKILTLLTRLLRQETTSWDARKLAVQWCEDILQSLQVQHAALFPKPEFCDLVSMVITSATERRRST
ncbi:PREDICTED: serine/threonine-protein kinase SMG1-like [Priapulus caudatus]|uniref:Serine/threonine-protein kinase SMG1-like n=1 Tax=Priapulus caudatus TaxID=37621 RepID=A0ABM1EWV1_PRICU|nr:PREDICTED: serine/threonine-protein kinase SMG1-like [Priapulus caudatus]